MVGQHRQAVAAGDVVPAAAQDVVAEDGADHEDPITGVGRGPMAHGEQVCQPVVQRQALHGALGADRPQGRVVGVHTPVQLAGQVLAEHGDVQDEHPRIGLRCQSIEDGGNVRLVPGQASRARAGAGPGGSCAGTSRRVSALTSLVPTSSVTTSGRRAMTSSRRWPTFHARLPLTPSLRSSTPPVRSRSRSSPTQSALTDPRVMLSPTHATSVGAGRWVSRGPGVTPGEARRRCPDMSRRRWSIDAPPSSTVRSRPARRPGPDGPSRPRAWPVGRPRARRPRAPGSGGAPADPPHDER